MIEELKQLLRQFSIKWWLLYYREKRKNAKDRGTVQQTSHTSEINAGVKWAMQHWDSKKHNSQSVAHSIPKSDDSWTADNNSRAKWKGAKRGRKRAADRDTN